MNAGGLQHCVETIEELAILDHDPNIQYRKEGVFTVGEQNEILYPVESRLSDLCLRDGITWDWFPENWFFGNGVTIHKTLASPVYRTAAHGTSLSLENFMLRHGTIPRLEHRLVRSEGLQEYEAQWHPGTCPQENHVHLKWMITTHRLPEFAYQRIRQLIEDGAKPIDLHLYNL